MGHSASFKTNLPNCHMCLSYMFSQAGLDPAGNDGDMPGYKGVTSSFRSKGCNRSADLVAGQTVTVLQIWWQGGL